MGCLTPDLGRGGEDVDHNAAVLGAALPAPVGVPNATGNAETSKKNPAYKTQPAPGEKRGGGKSGTAAERVEILVGILLKDPAKMKTLEDAVAALTAKNGRLEALKADYGDDLTSVHAEWREKMNERHDHKLDDNDDPSTSTAPKEDAASWSCIFCSP